MTVLPGNARLSPLAVLRRTVKDMDNRDEVRDFLTTRRERFAPGQAGVLFFRQGAPGAGGVLIARVRPLILEADYENLAGLLHG